MSRAFRSPTLKSSALVTLPEGKQTVRPTHIHRHRRPQFKRLHLDEPQQGVYPTEPDFARFSDLGVRSTLGCDRGRKPVRRGYWGPRVLGLGPASPKRQGLAPACLGGGLPCNRKCSGGKSIKEVSLWKTCCNFLSTKALFPSPGDTPLRSCSLLRTLHADCAAPCNWIWSRAWRAKPVKGRRNGSGVQEEAALARLLNWN